MWKGERVLGRGGEVLTLSFAGLAASYSCICLPSLLQDDQEGGRRRRARLEGEEEAADDNTGGLAAWFEGAAGSDEDADDLELLKRAQQGQALGQSAGEVRRARAGGHE